MKIHKMTPWDEGQVLIRAQDTLFDCMSDLKETKPEWCDELRKMALRIGTIFNKHKSHVFGLKDESEL